jgi:hypothetical protein
MNRDFRDGARVKALKTRSQGRREWGHNGDAEHQMEAREHARQPGNLQETLGVRDAEASPQIREPRARH